MKTVFKGRPVVDIVISGIDHNDAPKFCDAYIEKAVWLDTSEPLNEGELDELNEDSSLVHELTYEWIY